MEVSYVLGEIAVCTHLTAALVSPRAGLNFSE